MSTNSVKAGIGGLAAVLALGSGVAAADPGDEKADLGVFAGAQFLSPDIGVGSTMDPVERPQSAPLVGGRLTWIAMPHVGGGDSRLQVGVEAEAGMAAAYTGRTGTTSGGYFSPLVDWRLDMMLRLAIGGVRPHIAIGGGGVTFASASPTLDTKTVGEVFWGFGSTFAVSRDWDLRVDLRQDLLPRMGGGRSSSYEAVMGISVPLGHRHHHHQEVAHEAPPPARAPAPPSGPELAPPPPEPPAPLHAVTVATETPVEYKPVETPTAPTAPADPTVDSDKDGIPDVKDKCPIDAESANGFDDTDGCPDRIPEAITVAGPALKFKAGRAKLDAADETTLKPVVDLMAASPDLHLVVVGHPQGKGKSAHALAQKRADSVKWFLIQHGGASVDRVTSSVGAVAEKGGAAIDLQVATASH